MRQLIIGSSIWLLMTLGWVSLSSVMAADDPRSQTAEVEQTKSQAVQVLDDRNTNDHNLIAKIIVVAVMCLFLPLNTLTYYLFRRYRRRFEVERILEILPLYPKYEAYLKAYRDETSGRYFLWSVSYALVVSCLGLMLLFLSGGFFLASEFPAIVLGPSGPNLRFPAAGARLIAGRAVLGG
jgi:ABC-type glycerol-3-phosphate transport system permease component